MAPTVQCTDGTAMYGTNSALYITAIYGTNSELYKWHSNVCHQQCTVVGTLLYGTNSALYISNSNVWHQQCTVPMAQQCMAPTVHSVMVSQFVQQCSAVCSEGAESNNCTCSGEAGFVPNSLLIFKYSYKLMVVMTNCENDSSWLNGNSTEFACRWCCCNCNRQ